MSNALTGKFQEPDSEAMERALRDAGDGDAGGGDEGGSGGSPVSTMAGRQSCGSHLPHAPGTEAQQGQRRRGGSGSDGWLAQVWRALDLPRAGAWWPGGPGMREVRTRTMGSGAQSGQEGCDTED